jgi:hypothetical protein
MPGTGATAVRFSKIGCVSSPEPSFRLVMPVLVIDKHGHDDNGENEGEKRLAGAVSKREPDSRGSWAGHDGSGGDSNSSGSALELEPFDRARQLLSLEKILSDFKRFRKRYYEFISNVDRFAGIKTIT